MRIHLQKFRRWNDEVFEFDAPSTLLKGGSGSGKTSIFDAIKWCLYGSMRNIVPHNMIPSHKDQTCVTIWVNNDLTVQRTKPPEVVKVAIKGCTFLEGDAAQAYIYKTFGSENLWLATSYIQQRQWCPLMTLSNADKMELLIEMTFGRIGDNTKLDSPDYYSDKLDDALQVAKNTTQVLTSNFNSLSSICSEKIAAINSKILMWTILPTETDLKDLLELITTKTEKLTLQYRQMLEWTQYETTLNTLNTSLTSIVNERDIASIKIATMKNWPETIMSAVFHLESLTGQLNQAKVNASSYSSIPDDIVSMNASTRTQEIIRLKTLITTTKKYSDILSSAGIVHAEESVRTAIVNARGLIDAQDPIKEYNVKLNDYNTKVSLYNSLIMKLASVATKLPKDTIPLIDMNIKRDVIISKLAKYNEYIRWNTSVISNEGRQLELKHSIEKVDISIRSVVEENPAFPKIDSLTFQDECTLLIQCITSSLDILRCPHCAGGLRIVRGTIVKDEVELTLPNPTVVIDNLNKIKTLHSQKIQLCSALSQLITIREQLGTVDIEICPTDDEKNFINTFDVVVKAIHEYESLLMQVNAVVLPVHPGNCPSGTLLPPDSLAIINNLYFSLSETPYVSPVNILELTSRITQLELSANVSEFNIIIANFTSETEKASIIVKKLLSDKEVTSHGQMVIDNQEYTKCYLSILGFADRIRDISDKLGSIEVPTKVTPEDVSKSRKEVESLKERYDEGEKLFECYTIKMRLEGLQKGVVEQTKIEAGIMELKTMIVNVVNQSLQELVDEINSITNTVVRDLFSEDIIIELRLTKTLKSKDKIKPQVNILITYKDASSDSISILSGGEKDRLSMAFVIALSKLSPFPLLMLDESMTSMEPELRNLCLRAAQNNLRLKNIINVCHGIVEGDHDSTKNI